MIDLRIYNVPNGFLYEALSVAQKFDVGFPDRVGVTQGVGYRYGAQYFYAHRTKKGRIVVKGTNS